MTAVSGPATAPLLGGPLPVELMNTIWADRGAVRDTLQEPAGAAGWLGAVSDRLVADQDALAWWQPGALDPPVPESAAGQLRQLRDALRRLAADATGDPRLAGRSAFQGRDTALAVLNASCALAPSWSQLRWPAGGGPSQIVRSANQPAELAVSLLAEQAVALFASVRVAQLRACLAPGCVLYFLAEHPRREWCSQGCGNRARVARHYLRHRAQGAPS